MSEYNLTLMDLIDGETYSQKGVEYSIFTYSKAMVFSQSDRFKLVEKKPEVIETKWYYNSNVGKIISSDIKWEIGSHCKEVKPIDDSFTRWEVV